MQGTNITNLYHFIRTEAVLVQLACKKFAWALFDRECDWSVGQLCMIYTKKEVDLKSPFTEAYTHRNWSEK